MQELLSIIKNSKLIYITSWSSFESFAFFVSCKNGGREKHNRGHRDLQTVSPNGKVQGVSTSLVVLKVVYFGTPCICLNANTESYRNFTFSYYYVKRNQKYNFLFYIHQLSWSNGPLKRPWNVDPQGQTLVYLWDTKLLCYKV